MRFFPAVAVEETALLAVADPDAAFGVLTGVDAVGAAFAPFPPFPPVDPDAFLLDCRA